ncbi:MAG: hypothetical protein AAB455_00670 [Patescibacteria group bacterium]
MGYPYEQKPDVWFRFWVWLACAVGVQLILLVRHLTTSPSRRKEILEKNVRDYAQAECLKSQIFPRFANTRSDAFPLREGEIEGSWRPFKVEHFASQSLRGDISGQVCLDWRSFFRSGSGEVSGQLKQLAVPDLLDLSSVVFFENDRGETLRVLVPSPRATKETLARLIESYVGRDDPRGYHSGGILTRGTHTYEALKQFTTDETSLTTPISHPALLDRLDASTQKSLEVRPEVRVTGEMVQEGVALATALTVEGEKRTFFPSGYLGELASGFAFALDQDREPGNLLAAVA